MKREREMGEDEVRRGEELFVVDGRLIRRDKSLSFCFHARLAPPSRRRVDLIAPREKESRGRGDRSPGNNANEAIFRPCIARFARAHARGGTDNGFAALVLP